MFCSSGRRWKLGIPFLLYVSVLGWGLTWEYLSLSYHFNVWMFLFVPRVVGGHLVSVFPWGNCSKCSCTFQVHSWEFIKVLESPMLPFWLTLPSLFNSFIYLLWLCQALVVAYKIQFPDQRLNLGPLHWERGVVATEPSGKFPYSFFNLNKHDFKFQFSHRFCHRFPGFSGGANGKEFACWCRISKRCGFDPCIRKIPWRRKWQFTPVFLPGESLGQRSLVGFSVHWATELDMTEQLNATLT